MAFVRGGETSFFSEESYRMYIERDGSVFNERLRDKNETFFDAMLSEEADFTKTPEGKEILELLGSYK
jgi:hypothetical protein